MLLNHSYSSPVFLNSVLHRAFIRCTSLLALEIFETGRENLNSPPLVALALATACGRTHFEKQPNQRTQGLAWAAGVRGINAHVVMPRNSVAIKLAAVRDYGGSITLCESSKIGREKAAAAVMSSLPDSMLVHSSNDPRVQCGHGTVGLELVSQVSELTKGADLDAVIVPVGGGGLISGVATAVKALCPGVKVIGAEPEKAAAAFRSKQSGTLCGNDGEQLPDTIADGLRTALGPKAWPVVRDSVDEIVTVSEEDIRLWMRVVYERMKLVIEPSAAVGVAAVMSPQVRGMPAEMKRVGVVLCGGNMDVTKLQYLLLGDENCAPSLELP